MDVKILAMWAVSGMGLNLFGLLLLFWCGVPFQPRRRGTVGIIMEGEDAAGKRRERWLDVGSWLGLACAVIGSGLQAWVTARQGGLL